MSTNADRITRAHFVYRHVQNGRERVDTFAGSSSEVYSPDMVVEAVTEAWRVWSGCDSVTAITPSITVEEFTPDGQPVSSRKIDLSGETDKPSVY